jgi:hypothetical protein
MMPNAISMAPPSTPPPIQNSFVPNSVANVRWRPPITNSIAGKNSSMRHSAMP